MLKKCRIISPKWFLLNEKASFLQADDVILALAVNVGAAIAVNAQHYILRKICAFCPMHKNDTDDLMLTSTQL